MGSFRKLVQAKNAVTVYRGKGLSAFWSEVNLDGDEKWFRVYTGLFETRDQAKKFRKEQNLLKSLVKRTPNNAFVETHTDKQVPENKTLLKMPNLMNSEGATAETADVLIITPEKFAALGQNLPDLENSFDTIICDEGHLIDDGNRGLQYELLLTKLKSSEGNPRKIVFISAILPNVDVIHGWLGGGI